MKYASFFQRLIAYMLDGVILYIPFILVFGFEEVLNNTTITGIQLIAWTAYFVWMTGTYGATIGKMIMKIKVTKENGSKVSYSDALVREIASYLSAFVFFIGYLIVLWDKKNQGWHDKIAKTVVVRV